MPPQAEGGAAPSVQSDTYNLYPYATTPVVIGMTLLFVGLIGLAVFLEWLRRQKQRHEARRRAGLAVERIFREKDLSAPECDAMRGLIDAQGNTDPLSIATTRRAFNDAVSPYMAQMRGELPARDFALLGQTLRDVRIRLDLDYVPFGQPISSTRELTPGQTILARRKEQRDAPWFRLSVEAVDEAHVTAQARPVQSGAPLPDLGADDVLAARLWRRDDGRYSLHFGVAVPPQKDQPILLHHDNNMKRTQARAYLRIHHNQPATIAYVALPAGGQIEEIANRPAGVKRRGRITSLSAGGLAVEIDHPPGPNTVLRVPLGLPGREPFTVHAAIVGSHDLSGGRRLVRGAFMDLEEEQRDVIARYVWERQHPQGPGPHATA